MAQLLELDVVAALCSWAINTLNSTLPLEGLIHDRLASLPCASRGGIMVSGHCVVFLGKTLYSHSASHHPGV